MSNGIGHGRAFWATLIRSIYTSFYLFWDRDSCIFKRGWRIERVLFWTPCSLRLRRHGTWSWNSGQGDLRKNEIANNFCGFITRTRSWYIIETNVFNFDMLQSFFLDCGKRGPRFLNREWTEFGKLWSCFELSGDLAEVVRPWADRILDANIRWRFPSSVAHSLKISQILQKMISDLIRTLASWNSKHRKRVQNVGVIRRIHQLEFDSNLGKGILQGRQV